MRARCPSRLLAIAVFSVSSGCSRIAERSQPQTLTVFAAASLSRAFSQLGDTVQTRLPGLKLDFNFGGSQVLAFQIKQGAAADLFAAADEPSMRVVEDAGLVNGTPQIFAHNHLTVIVPVNNPGHITRLEDLSRKGVKLVLAGETVPAGRYARQVIANLARNPGFPVGYEAKTLGNVVSNEETVRGVVTKVQLGEADAGIVYVSDMTPEVGAQVRQIEIPAAGNVLAQYPVAILRHARNASAAHEFVGLLLSPAGQRILESNGFK
ncbi:MAG: molybdate ABC transporter substrate-binding protein [Gemmatimonadetes bacterium]|nr:molybdate ABC transporter substrate-binding protein [Gemmatimonadota bacterium]